MAKVKLLDTNTEGFEDAGELSISPNGSKAVLEYGDGGKIILFGDGIKGTADSSLKAGTVDRVAFINSDGDECIIVQGEFKAADIAGDSILANFVFKALFEKDDVITGSSANDYLTEGEKGNDKIFGKAGADEIDGGRGDDRLSGGAGPDTFSFYNDDGVDHDVITDFQVSGANADTLDFNGTILSKVASANGGDDTKLTFDNGSTILLKDVTKAEFNEAWDMV